LFFKKFFIFFFFFFGFWFEIKEFSFHDLSLSSFIYSFHFFFFFHFCYFVFIVDPTKTNLFFFSRFKKVYTTINLDQLQYYIDIGRLDPTKLITFKHFRDCGLVRQVKHGIKLLARVSSTQYLYADLI
jgi:hypothetical protein